MTIEDEHTLLLRAIDAYANTVASIVYGDAYQKDAVAAYCDIGPAIQALMLEVAEATACAVAVGDQRSMAQLYDATEPVIQEIRALGEDHNG
jgi:hypothetical protein